MKKPVIFHIDVNSAFLSWEAVYQIDVLKKSFDLRTVPSAVGGDESKRHGIILAKSTPAKKYQIRTGEPIVQALRKCPNLLLVPARFSIYIDYSNAMMNILKDYSPEIEKYSIDEAFLDMSETLHLFGSPMEVANQIKKRIYRELHFTVNIGVSTNKLLAKMASDFEKPNLCHSLFPEEMEDKMWPLPISELFFVGKSAEKKLKNLGIHTIGELAKSDLTILMSHLGKKYGQLIHSYANGIDDSKVVSEPVANKGYGNSITLSRDIDDFDSIKQVLLSLSETIGTRLRKENVRCNCIAVELKDCDFNHQSHQMTLSEPTDITNTIYENACDLFEQLWNKAPLRLIGIRTSKITEEPYTQLNLFSSKKDKKLEKLDSAIDSIRNRYGTDSIKRASFLDKDSICNHSEGSRH